MIMHNYPVAYCYELMATFRWTNLAIQNLPFIIYTRVSLKNGVILHCQVILDYELMANKHMIDPSSSMLILWARLQAFGLASKWPMIAAHCASLRSHELTPSLVRNHKDETNIRNFGVSWRVIACHGVSWRVMSCLRASTDLNHRFELIMRTAGLQW